MALVDFKRWALSAISYGLPAVCLLAAQPGVAQSLDAKSEQAMLFAQIQAHPADHQSTLRYAVVSAARGDTEAAIGALEKLLVFNPGLTRVKFELGVLYARLGANETAIQYLRAAKAGGGLLVAQQAQIDVILPELEKSVLTSRWFGKLQTGIRYQSNAGFQPDNGLFRSFGVNVTGPARGKSDFNAFQMAEIGNDYDLENSRGDRLETRVSGYATQQFRSSRYNIGLLSASFGPRLALAPESWPGATIKPYVVGLASTLNGANYLNSFGAGVGLRLPFGQFVSIEPGLEWRRLDVHDHSLNPTIVQLSSGDTVTASIAGIVKLSDDMTLETRARYTRGRGANQMQSFNETGADAMVRFEVEPPFDWIGRKWTIAPFAGISWISFDQPNPIVDPLVSRRDRGWRGGVSLEAPITPMFGFSGFVEYARNNSNLPNFRTNNLSVVFGPNLRF